MGGFIVRRLIIVCSFVESAGDDSIFIDIRIPYRAGTLVGYEICFAMFSEIGVISFADNDMIVIYFEI
jgi:hypothetical protein